MPYKSRAQRAYMHIHHPTIAKRWDSKYKASAKSKSLPKHAPKGKKK